MRGSRFPEVNDRSTGPVRGIELRRRRSRVPWIYTVYHARKRATGVEAAVSEAALKPTRQSPRAGVGAFRQLPTSNSQPPRRPIWELGVGSWELTPSKAVPTKTCFTCIDSGFRKMSLVVLPPEKRRDVERLELGARARRAGVLENCRRRFRQRQVDQRPAAERHASGAAAHRHPFSALLLPSGVRVQVHRRSGRRWASSSRSPEAVRTPWR